MQIPTSEDLKNTADSVCYLEYTEASIDFTEVPETPLVTEPADPLGPKVTLRQYVENRFLYAWRKDGLALIAIDLANAGSYPSGYTDYSCDDGTKRKFDFYLAP